MSLRYKWADIFWFTFFHEIAHVLLHDRKRLTFVDGPPNNADDNDLELEANSFASRTLIPHEAASRLPQLRTTTSVLEMASDIGIHPGIVVGRLQHEGLFRYDQFNDLRDRYQLS